MTRIDHMMFDHKTIRSHDGIFCASIVFFVAYSVCVAQFLRVDNLCGAFERKSITIPPVLGN